MSEKKDVLAPGVSLADSYSNPEFQRFCDWLWYKRAAGHCISELFSKAILPRVEELGIDYGDLVPAIDFEEALAESEYEWDGEHGAWIHADSREPISWEEDPEEAFDDLGLDRCDFEREVFEYWAVSDWWADQLEREGETCPDVLGLRVWLRTTTGQKTTMDGCTVRIARRLLDCGYGWAADFLEERLVHDA